MNEGFLFDKNPKTKIATITLNRPETLNGMKLADYDRMIELLVSINKDDDVKVVIMKGAGRAFCGGHDLSELQAMYAGKPGERRLSQRHKLWIDAATLFGRRGVYTTLATCWKATIIQAHKYCYGVGLYFAMAADIVISADNCLFTHPGWRDIGPISAWQLIMNVGLKKAKEMMLTTEPIDAKMAYECGLVNKVVPLDKLDEEVQRTAKSIARLPLDGLVLGKQNFEAAMEAMGMGQGYGTIGAMHTLQTNIRYEPDEFSLMKEIRDKGVKGAIKDRIAYFKT